MARPAVPKKRKIAAHKVPKDIDVLIENQVNPVGRPILSGSQLELNPELMNKIAGILRFGSYIEVAAAMNGIGYSTLRTWITKAKEYPDSLYGEFARAVEKAVSEAEVRDLAVVDQHAQGRAAVYEMVVVKEYVLDKNGDPVKGEDGSFIKQPMKDAHGNPVTEIAKDKEGNPILKRSEIKANWTAAAWKLERRNPNRWGRREYIDEVHRNITTANAPIDEKEIANEANVKAILAKVNSEI